MYELVYNVLDKEGCVYTDDMGNLQLNRDLLNWFTCIHFCYKSKLFVGQLLVGWGIHYRCGKIISLITEPASQEVMLQTCILQWLDSNLSQDTSDHD
jgi:hypothetical protein